MLCSVKMQNTLSLCIFYICERANADVRSKKDVSMHCKDYFEN